MLIELAVGKAVLTTSLKLPTKSMNVIALCFKLHGLLLNHISESGVFVG